jgi:hypothetical protein
MADPIITNTENHNIIWQILTWLLGFLTVTLMTILGWTWKKQDGKVTDIEDRLTDLETNSLTRAEFNGAQETNRRENKENIANVVAELRACSQGIHASVEGMKNTLDKRMDSILMMHIKEK